MLQYYLFLSKAVNVKGTDKNEFFKVKYHPDGRVDVKVRKIDKSGDLKQELYKRTFISAETDEIRLYGVEGDDTFEFQGEGPGTIKVRVIPGQGEKTVEDKGITDKKNTLIYQNRKEQIPVELGESTKIKFSPSNLSYNRAEFKYDKVMPLATVAYNRDDGIFLGAGLLWEKQGFNKEPFSIRQSIMGKYAIRTNAFNIEYEGHAVNVLGKFDLIWEADVRAPQYSFNYFGIGNETEFNPETIDIVHYQSRFNLYEAYSGLQAKLGESGSFNIGPNFQVFRFDPSDNAGKFITSPESGLDQVNLDQAKFCSGPSAKIVFDTRDQKQMPTRGLHFVGQTKRVWGLNDFSKNFTSANAELALYWSFRYP